MVSWKDEFKQAGIELGYDLLLVGLLISWITAITLVILEISLWYVFGFFLLGCIFLFSMIYVYNKYGKEETDEIITKNEEANKETT